MLGVACRTIAAKPFAEDLICCLDVFEMLYSGIRRLRRQLPSCFAALILCGCGNGEHAATAATDPATLTGTQQNSIPSKTTVAITASTNEGGYLTDQNAAMFCDSTNEFCNYLTAYNAIESIKAISRFGYQLVQWQSSATEQTASSVALELIANEDISVQATFEKRTDISAADCSAPVPSKRFRTLHLGDSLTEGQCWKTNCIPQFATDTKESERESIRFYETGMASNADAPRTIAVGGTRINGTNIALSSDGNQPSGFEADNFWQWSLSRHQESPEDFDAVVVGLGTNDIADIFYDVADVDAVFENRVKPLLQWIGGKPIFWILPHYSLKPFANGGINLYAKADGIACSCGDNATATTQCDLVQALNQCNAPADKAGDTVKVFKAVHAFRMRMLELQYEYPNLHVIDAEQLIAERTHGQYDLYQQLKDDKLHFLPQGLEWYAWVHAYLGQSTNTACALPVPHWEMSAAEIAMMSQLEAAPY